MCVDHCYSGVNCSNLSVHCSVQCSQKAMSQFLELPDSTAAEINMTEYSIPATDPESLSLISEWETYQEGYNTDMSEASKGKLNEEIVESKTNHSIEGLSVSEMTGLLGEPEDLVRGTQLPEPQSVRLNWVAASPVRESFKAKSVPRETSLQTKRAKEDENVLRSKHRSPRAVPKLTAHYFSPCTLNEHTGEKVHAPFLQTAQPALPCLKLERYAEERSEMNIHRDLLYRMQAIKRLLERIPRSPFIETDLAMLDLQRYCLNTLAKEILAHYGYEEPEVAVIISAPKAKEATSKKDMPGLKAKENLLQLNRKRNEILLYLSKEEIGQEEVDRAVLLLGAIDKEIQLTVKEQSSWPGKIKPGTTFE